MRILPSNTVLLIVDPQRAFGEILPVPGAGAIVGRLRRLRSMWEAHGGKVIQTRHIYENPSNSGWLESFIPGIGETLTRGSVGSEWHQELEPTSSTLIVEKSSFSAWTVEALRRELRSLAPESILVGGFTTPICVSASVRDLTIHGLSVCVLEDGCASQPIPPYSAEETHRHSIAVLRYAFARIVSIADIESNLHN